MKVLPWELRKLVAQQRVRLLFLVCVVGPPLLAVVLRVQGGLPKDTLFGRYVHDSGFALPLLVLGFAGTWAFPLLTSLVAGDIFASEDSQGTWQAILTRSRSRGEVFTGKVVAAALAALAFLAVTALSSLLAGLIATGHQPLIGLSGTELSPSRAVTVVLLSWAAAAPPLLAFTGLACMFSVISRSPVVGVGAPVVLGLLMQLLSLLGGLGQSVNALPTTAFAAWRGLVRDDSYVGPLWQGVLVSAVWAVASIAVARVVLLRRDIT